ncbi:MAG: SAM-dependent methyltransferase, partial [Acidobacteriota bacterium]
MGAGPGDPDLLTVGGAATLRQADVVFHDALIRPEVLSRAGRRCRLVPVG